MKHFNQLTPTEAENLAILLEEMGEAHQAIGKILRHGYDSKHPAGGPTNREHLERELGDVQYAIKNLTISGELQQERIKQWENDKARNIVKYLHHSK